MIIFSSIEILITNQIYENLLSIYTLSAIRRPPMSHMNLKVPFIILFWPIMGLVSCITALNVPFTNYLGHYRP